METWKSVVGYEGYYEVSNTGKVRSIDRFVRHSGTHTRFQKGNVLNIHTNSTGHYSTVLLSKENKKKNCKVHRLVAMAFIENPLCLPEVNHKDENKQNNNVENLEWCDKVYNNNYGTKNQRRLLHLDTRIIAQKNSKKVVRLDLNGNVLEHFASIAEINRKYGYSCGNISMACNGKYVKPLYGSYWRWDI